MTPRSTPSDLQCRQSRNRIQRSVDKVLDRPILQQTVHLVPRHPQRVPAEDRVAQDRFHDRVHHDRFQLFAVDPVLFGGGGGGDEGLDVFADSGDGESDLAETDTPAEKRRRFS